MTGDTATPTDSSTTTPTDSGSVTSGVTGSLSASVGTQMVNISTIQAQLDTAADLVLDCVGAGEHQVPETHRWSSSAAGETHQATLRGLLADTEYTCAAAGHPLVEPVSFTTGSLPEELTTHVITLETWESGAQAGWTLINPWTFLSLNDHRDAYLAVVDMEGRVRWYYATDEDGIVAFEYNLAEQAFWTGGGLTDIYEPTSLDLDANVLHQTSSEADHDVFWLGDSAWTLVNHPTGTCIEQRDWATDALGARTCTGDLGLSGLNLNSLYVVAVDDGHVAYGGSATSDRIIKVHVEDATLEWVYGPGYDFAGDIVFSYTHDVNVVSCDGYDVCLSYYDNGEDVERSEAEIVGLDETAMTAESVRVWSEEGWYEPRMGGVQVLPEGNLLIGVGHLEINVPDSDPSQVIEVAQDDSVVWRLRIGPEDSAIYRARRVQPCDLFGHTGYCPALGE